MGSRARRFFLLAGVALAAAAALAPAPAFALASHSDTDVRARWLTDRPTYAGTAFATTPSSKAPYAAGALRPEFVADGLKMTNFVRYVAGLPDDVTLDTTYANDDQHAAVLLAALGRLTHAPSKPPDMSDAFYQPASTGCGSSNLAMGFPDLESSVLAYMDDGDTGNIDRVGHRRWILDPPLAKTGFGFADGYSAMWTFDWSRAATVDYDFIAWPAAGPFPLLDPVSGTRFFSSRQPWSITLNPAKYSWNVAEGLTVTLRRISDGRTWTFDKSDTNESGEYFNFETNGYGVPDCVIFRPDPAAVTYSPGDVFDVTLAGGIYAKGTSRRRTVTYRTRFISLSAPVPRISGADRYATAVAVSRRGFPADHSASGVVVCTGGTFADALATSALAGKLHAPVLLQPSGAPLRTDVLAEIRRVLPAGGRVTIAGGTGAVSAAVERSLASEGFGVSRIAGVDRYATAASVATATAGAGSGGTVFLATGGDFPDALAASAEATARRRPILLTRTSALPSPAIAALEAIRPDRVVVLGGTGAVSETVRSQVKAITGLPDAGVPRWRGDDRYATAADVVRHLRAEGSSVTTLAVATGASFPDALVTGPMIGEADGVMLLTAPASLPAPLTTLLGEIAAAGPVKRLDFVGSAGAMSDAVCLQIRAKLQP